MKQLHHPLARLRAEEPHATLDAELARSPLERLTVRPFARDHQMHVAAHDRLQRAVERFLGRQTPGERDRGAIEPQLALQLLAITQAADDRHWIRQHRKAFRCDTPRDGKLAEICARREHVRRVAKLDVARKAQRCDDRTTARTLELVHVSLDVAAAVRTLESRVGCQLDDVRPARDDRAERAAPEHPGRVDDVILARAIVDERRPPEVTNALPALTRDGSHGIRALRGRRVRRRHDFDAVTAGVQEVRDVRRVARGTTDIRRPDARDDQDVHATAGSIGPADESGSRSSFTHRTTQQRQ